MIMRRLITSMLLLALAVTGAVAGTARQVDICIYGGTSSGVMAGS